MAADYWTWKHHPPVLGGLDLPSHDGRTPLVYFLCVRNVVGWLQSMAKEPYTLFTDPHKTRPRGETAWMMDPAELRESQSEGRKWRFANGLAMYYHYLQGYLQGSFRVPAGTRIVVVRHEDLLEHQPALVNYFAAALGIPRNQSPLRCVTHAWGTGGLVGQAWWRGRGPP